MSRRPRLGAAWDALGRTNALGAILTRDGQLAEWDLEEFWATGWEEVERFLKEVSLLAPSARRGRAFDFGCGVGRISRALAEHCEAVTGVDVAESMVEQARAMNADRPACTFILNRTPDLAQFPTAAFDLVYSRLVLQHIPPRLSRVYVAELVRLLAPCGVLMFQLPQPDGSSRAVFTRAPVTGHPLKRLIPRPLVWLWRRMKYRLAVSSADAWREIYGVPKSDVEAIVERAGGHLLAALPDCSHGVDGSGFEYWVAK